MSPQMNMAPPAFRSGQPTTYIATRSFQLGTSGVTAHRGMEIQFDGTHVAFEGTSMILPQLRGAIREGWVVPAEQFNPNAPIARPRSAGMQVRPAEGGNPMQPRPRVLIDTSNVEAEEREVEQVNRHANATRARNATNYRRQGGEVVRNNSGQMEVIEDQDGVTVRAGLKTPARQVTNFERTSPMAAIQQANNVSIDPGQGRTREEMLASMDEGARLEYEAELSMHKSYHVDEPIIVGHVPAPGARQMEGFSVRGSVGNGIDIADAGGTGGKAEVTVTEQDGIRFTNTNGPKKGVRLVATAQAPAPVMTPGSNSEHDAMCRRIARSVCRDFPANYVFTDPVRKKIARLQADFEDRPDVIRAVAAADTDPELRSRLFEEFASAFAD